MTVEVLGVAEAKRRFSELVDRVRRGERFIVCRRGKPAVALTSPEEAHARPRARPVGLAAVAGALADWDDLEEIIEEIHAARRRAKDRDVPDLE
ncbi:MAG: type II toxin-antitoxin system Phd/YefM family antitoxin [Acidobacteriota bacterium]